MTEYITRSSALQAVGDIHPLDYNGQGIVERIKRIPAADVVEVRHGRWVDKMLDKFRKYEVVCSECGARYIGNYDAYDEPSEFNYCPNCGTQMDGGQDE
jgi:rubrerythrin